MGSKYAVLRFICPIFKKIARIGAIIRIADREKMNQLPVSSDRFHFPPTLTSDAFSQTLHFFLKILTGTPCVRERVLIILNMAFLGHCRGQISKSVSGCPKRFHPNLVILPCKSHTGDSLPWEKTEWFYTFCSVIVMRSIKGRLNSLRWKSDCSKLWSYLPSIDTFQPCTFSISSDMEEIAIVRSLSGFYWEASPESELYSTSCPFLSRSVSKCVSCPFMLLCKANLKAPVSKIVDFQVLILNSSNTDALWLLVGLASTKSVSIWGVEMSLGKQLSY